MDLNDFKKRVVKVLPFMAGVGAAGWMMARNMMKPEKKTVYVDFDKTITSTDFPELAPPQDGCREVLTELLREHHVAIWSCRWSSHWVNANPLFDPSEQVLKVKEYMREYNLPYTRLELRDKPFGTIVCDNAHNHSGDWGKTLEKVRGGR